MLESNLRLNPLICLCFNLKNKYCMYSQCTDIKCFRRCFDLSLSSTHHLDQLLICAVPLKERGPALLSKSVSTLKDKGLKSVLTHTRTHAHQPTNKPRGLDSTACSQSKLTKVWTHDWQKRKLVLGRGERQIRDQHQHRFSELKV